MWRFKKAFFSDFVNSKSVAETYRLFSSVKENAVPVCGASTHTQFIFSFKQDFSIIPSRVLHFRCLQRYNRSLRLPLTKTDVYI